MRTMAWMMGSFPTVCRVSEDVCERVIELREREREREEGGAGGGREGEGKDYGVNDRVLNSKP